MCASAFKSSDLRKGVVEVLSPEGAEREKSVSGSIFTKCSVWGVYLTDSITLGGDCHFFTDEETA